MYIVPMVTRETRMLRYWPRRQPACEANRKGTSEKPIILYTACFGLAFAVAKRVRFAYYRNAEMEGKRLG